MAKPLLVPQGGVRPSSERDTDHLLEDQSPGQGNSQDWGGGRAEMGACVTCSGSRASSVLSRLAEGLQIPGCSVPVCVCVRVEEPQGELLQRSLFACLSGSGVEFHYYMIELSLLHRPHPSPVTGPGASLGMSAGGQGRAATGLSSEVLEEAKTGTTKDRSWLWISTKIQKSSGRTFIEPGQKNTE